MVTMTSAEAQNRFGQLLDTAQREIVEITRHGRPVAFLVSPREIESILEAQERRKKALVEFKTWQKAAAKKKKPGTSLSARDISRIVRDLQ